MQFFFVLYPCAVIISRLFTGRLSDIFSPVVVIIPSIILSIISLLMIFRADSIQFFSVAAVCYGLGYGSLMPIMNAEAVRHCPREKRGSANATFYIALDLGVGGGSILLGWLTNFISPASMYLVAAGSVAFSLVLYLIIYKLSRT